MRNFRRNNVHVNGELKWLDECDGSEFVKLRLGNSTPIMATVPKRKWEEFQSKYPNERNLSISGVLNRLEDGNNLVSVINDNSIGLFHDVLGEGMETIPVFCGAVRLVKKFTFNTVTKLYLMRMIFTTIDSTPTTFEAVAVRSIVPYFEKIEEGTTMYLKAMLMHDEKFHPYWKITHKPITF